MWSYGFERRIAKSCMLGIDVAPDDSNEILVPDINSTINLLFFSDICTALQSLLYSLHHAGYGVPLSNVYSVYLTSPKELTGIAGQVMVQYQYFFTDLLCRKYFFTHFLLMRV